VQVTGETGGNQKNRKRWAFKMGRLNASRRKKTAWSVLMDKTWGWWMRTPVGGLFHMGLVKLSPIQQQLHELEIQNITNYYAFLKNPRRWPIFRFYAWLWSYVICGFRLLHLTPQARQDYYALNRQSTYASSIVPTISGLVEQASKKLLPKVLSASICSLTHESEKLPVLVVPGLNTPPCFFREMVEHFREKGYPIYVAEMPKQGLASLDEAAHALNEQVTTLRTLYNVDRVHVVGHCLGGLVAKYLIDYILDPAEKTPIKTLVTLGTGYMGANGVQRLKDYWIPRNPDKPVPVIFDQLVKARLSFVHHGADVVYHSIMAVWDFMVPFQNGILHRRETPALPVSGEENVSEHTSDLEACQIHNHLVDDWKVDHLTLVLNKKSLDKIEECLESNEQSKPAASA
jgi:pimeloyl-ACP methyl ester carboxylesterase